MRTSGPGQSALLLLDAVAFLDQEHIDYAVIGGMAASVYGVVRASMGADAILPISLPEIGKLEAAFKDQGFATELRRGDLNDPIAALLALSDSYGNRVELLAGLRGMEMEAFSRSIEVPFQGSNLRVIGREDFIAMKLFAGGPLDLDDARHAIEFGRESLNTILLRRLTEGYGAAAVSQLDNLLGK